MSDFNSSVFANCLIAEGFKEIDGPNATCRRFKLHSSEGLELAELDLDHRNTSTIVFMQQEYEWNLKTAKMLGCGDDFVPPYKVWLRMQVERATKAQAIGFKIIRRIEELYAKSAFHVHAQLDFNMPFVNIQCADGEDFYTIQTYSVCVDPDKMFVHAHIAGRGTRYESEIKDDLEFVKLNEWLSTQHKTGFSHLQSPIIRTVDGRKYHVYRPQDAARNLPLYRGAKTVKIIRETLVTKFESDDVFDLIGEIDSGRTTYEFIAYEIGVVI